jgi:hypothetical protein
MFMLQDRDAAKHTAGHDRQHTLSQQQHDPELQQCPSKSNELGKTGLMQPLPEQVHGTVRV